MRASAPLVMHAGLSEEEGHMSTFAGGKAISEGKVTYSGTFLVSKNNLDAMHPFRAHSSRKRASVQGKNLGLTLKTVVFPCGSGAFFLPGHCTLPG